ncbi:hypothetical protein TSOC_007878 [Tetrabaena socialis]|uniref:Uncharacterized protein n=1 Tax=Tetrabaena socialis TaxID=47790 RepID=A0A2J7ZZX0_9CHLO|nr:hypothetical protein TSOC_007878 [Tetrabaena socialis]|eukprot:PNH05814.1 hypothetical protein TSOC_007878 [Tetrabaena socialis]
MQQQERPGARPGAAPHAASLAAAAAAAVPPQPPAAASPPAPVAAANAFPLAPLLAVLLRRLPRFARLLLTATSPPGAHGTSGTATAADLAAWLCGRPSAFPSPRASASGPTPVAALLPVSALRDDSHLAASLSRQLVLRAGPDAAPPLLATMLARGRDNLSYYVACLRLHALRAESLPACADAAHAAVFAQELRPLSEAERGAARSLLALLAAAQEPVPMRLLARLGLAGALPLLPGWGSLFGEGRDRRVLVSSASVAGWLRGPAAAAAGLCTPAQLAAAHGLLAAALCEELYGGGGGGGGGDLVSSNTSRLDGGQDPAGRPGGRAVSCMSSSSCYSRRYLPAHLAAAVSLAAAAREAGGGGSTGPGAMGCGPREAQGVGLELSRLSLSAPAAPARSGGGAATSVGGVEEGPRAAPSLAQLEAWAALVAADPRFAAGGERAATSARQPGGQEQPRGAACVRPAGLTA